MKCFQFSFTRIPVSAFGMGTSDFGSVVSDDDACRLIELFLQAGGNFFDTAHCYAFWMPNGLGASERSLGNAIRRLGVRDSVVVASKGGHPPDPQFPQYHRPGPYLSPETICSDIQESVERLGFAPIDLYFLHRDDGETPVGEIIEVLNEAIQQGSIAALGASNWHTERIAEANAYAKAKGLQGFAVSEVHWSLAKPNWEPTETEPAMRFVGEQEEAWHLQSGLPIIAYSATASGYFARNPRNAGLYNNALNEGRRERAEQMAQELSCTPTQVALAYLLNQPIPTVPLFGTANPDHLREILAAAEIVLTPAQVKWLRIGTTEL
ncbi:MAG: aldo/keto reductase [Armatimonadaceae bacterium]